MNTLHTNKDGSVTLCGRRGACCPTMKRIDDDTIEITDDRGNTIRVSKEQASLIQNGIETLESSKTEIDTRKLINE